MPRDFRSPEAAQYRKLYNTARWRHIRDHQLSARPLCEMCEADGKLATASVCDHIEPHKGDHDKFYAGPYQSLCKACHDGPKQKQERRGYVIGCGPDGTPIDGGHPWNRD